MEKVPNYNVTAARAAVPNQGLHFAEYAINTLLAGLFAWSVSYALISAAHFEIKAVPALINILAICFILSAFLYNRYTTIVFLAGTLLSAGGYTWYLFRTHKTEVLVKQASDIFYWLTDYLNYEVPLKSGYSEITALVLYTLVSFLTVLFIVRFFNFYIVTILGCGVFISQWIMDFFVSDAALYVFIMIFLMLYFKKIYSSGQQQNTSGVFIIWTVPVCLLVIMGAAMIPSKPTPIEWEWLDKKISVIYNRINDYFEEYYNSEFFSFNRTGFGKSGRLGGRVSPDSRNVLSVQSGRRVYLAGAIKDTYTGHSWINTNIVSDIPYSHDASSEFAVDSLETSLGFRINSFIDNVDINEIYNEDNITVTLADMKTRTVFYPSKTTNIELNDSVSLLMRSNGDLYTNQLQNKGFSYSITYSAIHRENPYVETLLRKSRKGYYDGVQDSGYGRKFNYLFDARIRQLTVNDAHYYRMRDDYFLLNRNLQAYKARAAEIYSKYTVLPETLPARVKELAQSLTAGMDNDYDKIKALEKYVSSFPYTLKTNDTPRERDFVDYFLFDLKQGYCTYYASAIAVLARSIGIPSRYVEGYITPAGKSEQDTFEITNDQAHAWAEMYFEGFGWIPFEATRAFSYNFYHSALDTGDSGEEEIPENFELEETEEETEADSGTLGYTESSTSAAVKTLILMAVFISMLLLTLLGFVSYNAFRCFIAFNRAGSENPREAAVFYYSAILKLAGLNGHAIKDNETPLQYSSRLGTHYYLGSGAVSKITDIFMKARYGNKRISEEELALMVSSYKKMIEIIKDKYGNLRFFIFRYVLGKI